MDPHPPELPRPPTSSQLHGDVRALEAALGAVATETSGATLGAYKLLQKLGEGGFGVVWMAEQQEPIRRRVALKIIKIGMDTEEVIARFEAERQALALMEHPNIARVFDAGATDSGRPYFVMELVRGVAITRYCDEHRLPTADRLRLFISVCSAVQHAHQKGVIHRDLKPSNILVTLHDGAPVPKVIDFGIAKATSGRLTDQTLFTRFHTFLGTPAYTSPEQAILLRLVGGLPTRVRDEDLVALAHATIAAQSARLGPEAPSVAVSTLGLAVLLGNRPETADEGRILEQEAAAILERNRQRGLAPDLEAIVALGECASNRILGGAPEQAIVLAEQRLLLARAGFGPSLAEMPSPLMLSAMACFYTGRPAEAVPFWEEITTVRTKQAAASAPILGNLSLLGAAYREIGRLEDAERAVRDGLTAMRQAIGETGKPDPAVAVLFCELGLTLNAQSRFAEAEKYLRQSLENHDRAAHEKAAQPRNRLWQHLRPRAEAESGLGEALAGQGQFAEAEPLLLRAIARLEAQRGTLGGDRGKLLREAASRLAAFYAASGQPEKALAWRRGQP